MENFVTNLQSTNTISFDDDNKVYLLKAASWAMLLSILGFIILGFMILISIIIIVIIEPFYSNSYESFNMSRDYWYYAVINILFAIIFYFPINYLSKFSYNIKQGINTNNQELFTSGLRNLKSHFKFIGIFTLVTISIYTLAFIMFLVRLEKFF